MQKSTLGTEINNQATIDELQKKLQEQAAQLELSNGLLNSFLNNFDEVFFSALVNPVRLTHISASCQKAYGYTAEEFISSPSLWRDVVYEEDREEATENFKKLWEGKTVVARHRIIHKDNSLRWIETTKTPVFDANGTLVRIDGINKDVTKLYEATELIGKTHNALQESEDKFRMLFERSEDGLLIARQNGTFLEANNAICQMFGYTRKEFLQLDRASITVADDELEKGLKNREEKGQAHGILKMKHKNGNLIDAEVSSALFKDKNNSDLSYVCVRDVTEKLKAERKIIRSESNLNAIINNTSDSIFAIDRNSKIIAFNQTFIDSTHHYTGIRFNEDDDFFNDGVGKQMQARWHKYVEQVFAGEQFRIEERYPFEGNTRYSEIFLNPIKQGDEITGMVCFSRDITKAKQNAALLENSERRFRVLFENSRDIVLLTNADGSVRYVSSSAHANLGYDTEGMIGTNPYVLIHPDDHAMMGELFKKLKAHPGGSARAEWRQKHMNGSWLWMEGVATNLLDDPAVNACVCNFRDITERKIAEQELEKVAAELNQIFNNVDEGLFAIDMQTRNYLHMSDGCCRIYGYSVAEFKADNLLWYNAIHPDDKIIADRLRKKIAEGERTEMQVRIFNKSQNLRWIEAKIIPTVDKSGVLTRLDGVVKDITDRKNAEEELRLLNLSLEKKVAERTSQLNEANQMLQSFSFSVAHDLQAPLRILKGYASVLKEEHYEQLNDEGQRLLSVIVKYAGNMSKLIADLLNFSQVSRSSLSFSKVNNKKLVSEVIDTVRQMYPTFRGEVRLGDLGACTCDPDLMKQVWLNLISNALKYSQKEAEPIVEIGMKKVDGENVYSVKDNGVGFDMKHKDKLFEVFQRLHKQSEFEGTGVGLAIANTIITKHGGRIWVEAEKNHGATFYFTCAREQKA